MLRHTGRERERGQGPAGENPQQNAEAAADRGAVFQGGNIPAPGANAQGGENQVANGNAPLILAGPAGGPNPPATLARDPNTNEVIHFINRIAHMNLAAESSALNLAVQPSAPEPGAATPPVAPPGGGPPIPPTDQRAERPLETVAVAVEAAVEPSLVHRSTTFLALFVTSLVPAIWERRRARLRQRERWVRDMFVQGQPSIGAQVRGVDSEASAPQPSGAELAQRRTEALAGWRRAYVERVISGEAGDDAEL